MSDTKDYAAALALEKEKELALSGSDAGDANTRFPALLAELEEPSRHVYNHTTKM